MLTIWGRASSSNVQALMWCVGELGFRYQRHDIGHIHGGTESEAFERLNPNRTVPVLQDGDTPPLWETGAILRYLAARYGSGAFWPNDPVQRAHVDRWAEWAKLNVAMAFTVPVFWRVVRTPVAEQDHVAIAEAVQRLEDKLRIAEAELSRHAFLAGEEFTLADIQFGHVLFRYFDIEIVRAELPALRAYYDRLCARPAFQEHVMLSYDVLRVR